MRKEFKIVEKSKIWFSISIAIILLGCLFMAIFGGLNLGVDFTGGATVEVSLPTNYSELKENRDKVSKEVNLFFSNKKLKVETEQYAATSTGGALELKFQQKIDNKEVTGDIFAQLFKGENGEVGTGLNYELSKILNDKFGDEENEFKVTYNVFTKSASSELILNTLIAVLVAVVLILVYIGFRFTWSSGFAAVIALCHDVLIMLSLVAIFRLQVNASFIAALITIIGYSINATIIIFDKVRENSKLASETGASCSEIMNNSITQTISRTINTTVTTMLAITVLAVLGVPAIREFTIPIIFGLLAGTYSSVFISGSLWVMFQKGKDKFKQNKIYKNKQKPNKKQIEKA